MYLSVIESQEVNEPMTFKPGNFTKVKNNEKLKYTQHFLNELKKDIIFIKQKESMQRFRNSSKPPVTNNEVLQRLSEVQYKEKMKNFKKRYKKKLHENL